MVEATSEPLMSGEQPQEHQIPIPSNTNHITPTKVENENSHVVNIGRVMTLLLASTLATLILTVVPVLFDLPLLHPKGWYEGNDILRLLEPIIAGPLQFLVLWYSEPLIRRSKDSLVVVTLFIFCQSVYQQGAGFHSCSNMIKHAIETYLPVTEEAYVWVRTTWEHLISHYIYAGGGILMSFVHAYAFRNTRGTLSKGYFVVWILAVIVYGLTIAAIAIQFPLGGLVALPLCVIWGFGVIGLYLVKRVGLRGTFLSIRYPVLQYYLFSYIIGFLIVVGWMGKYGLKNRSQVNGKDW